MPSDEYERDVQPPEREQDTIVVEDELLREGFTQVPNVLLRRPDVTHAAKIAYALLLSYAWHRDRCFPGQDVLAADMGVERKAVIRYLQELKARGLILVKRRGMGKTNVYYLPRFPDVPKMGHQEVPPVGQANVRPVGHKEYSSKNTQYEEDFSNFERHHRIAETINGRRGRGAPAPSVAAQPVEQDELTVPSRAVPLGEILKLRQRAAASIGQGSRGTKADPAPAQSIAADRPASSRTGRLKGTAEERERLRAFLGDFAAELGDEASLASSITRALNLFREAQVPPERWGDYLYQARAITQERTAQITKQSSNGRAIRRKNKMPYFFEVLEDLLGLRAAPSPPPA